MIDKRLLDPRFNPIDDYAAASANQFINNPQFVSLFDRIRERTLAALIAANAIDFAGAKVSENEALNEIVDVVDRLAVKMLEGRTRRLGIEVTP